MKKDHERFKTMLLERTQVGDIISSIGAIGIVLDYLENGEGGRYHSTLFVPSRHQVGYIMRMTEQFEKIETRGSAQWRRVA